MKGGMNEESDLSSAMLDRGRRRRQRVMTWRNEVVREMKEVTSDLADEVGDEVKDERYRGVLIGSLIINEEDRGEEK